MKNDIRTLALLPAVLLVSPARGLRRRAGLQAARDEHATDLSRSRRLGACRAGGCAGTRPMVAALQRPAAERPRRAGWRVSNQNVACGPPRPTRRRVRWWRSSARRCFPASRWTPAPAARAAAAWARATATSWASAAAGSPMSGAASRAAWKARRQAPRRARPTWRRPGCRAQGELAVDYIGLRLADAQQALLADTITGYQRSLQIAQNRYQARRGAAHRRAAGRIAAGQRAGRRRRRPAAHARAVRTRDGRAGRQGAGGLQRGGAAELAAQRARRAHRRAVNAAATPARHRRRRTARGRGQRAGSASRSRRSIRAWD